VRVRVCARARVRAGACVFMRVHVCVCAGMRVFVRARAHSRRHTNLRWVEGVELLVAQLKVVNLVRGWMAVSDARSAPFRARVPPAVPDWRRTKKSEQTDT
jgi:hypothetical protein